MALIDFGLLADVDLSEIMDREIPCETRSLDGKPLPGCTDVAAYWMKLTCRSCGYGERILTCPPCTTHLGRLVRVLNATILPWLKIMKHGKCRRPIFVRLTSGSL